MSNKLGLQMGKVLLASVVGYAFDVDVTGASMDGTIDQVMEECFSSLFHVR